MKNRDMISFAAACIRESEKPRPEITWLKERYDRFCQKYELSSKEEADGLLYEKMYAMKPRKSTELLKIRYWRTGKHLPVSREQCISFGRALDLSPEELLYLIQYYYDRSDQVFEAGDTQLPQYLERKAVMDELVKEYLEKVHPNRLIQLRISPDSLKSNLRHIYFTDAGNYIYYPDPKRDWNRHIISVGYGSELERSLNLLGEIPRKTILRHIILLGMPYLNHELLNQRLKALGYAPLDADHTLRGGERLDWLLIRLLELYEQECTGREPEECLIWFQQVCRELDQYFLEQRKNGLRFMYFKALQ